MKNLYKIIDRFVSAIFTIQVFEFIFVMLCIAMYVIVKFLA